MNKTAALYNFFSGFGITAYPANAVPANASFPYLTYENTIDYWGSDSVDIVVNIWYRTESEATPNAKVDAIAQKIGYGGALIKYDGGAIWIKRGSPFSSSLNDPDDNSIKRRIVNLRLEYLSI